MDTSARLANLKHTGHAEVHDGVPSLTLEFQVKDLAYQPVSFFILYVSESCRTVSLYIFDNSSE